MKRKNFAFRFEWMEAIASYDPIVRLEIYEATVMYAETGRLPEMSCQAQVGFDTYIRPDFERRRKAAEYRARAKARREAADKPAETVEVADAEPIVEQPEVRAVIMPDIRLNRRERRRLEAEQRRKSKHSGFNKNCNNLP